MPDYEVCIIKDDNEFILKIVSLITNHILPVVNGMFGLDGRLIVKWRNDWVGHGALAQETNEEFVESIKNKIEFIYNFQKII